jgi:hypothetical protein
LAGPVGGGSPLRHPTRADEGGGDGDDHEREGVDRHRHSRTEHLGQQATEGRLRLQDPRDIRAPAHPARMAIIDALASGDELTATECAGLTGLSPVRLRNT